jgi:TPR repeat protein
MSAGGFSVVFKMKDEQSGKFYAVKCFTKEQEGRSESYKLIADELEFVSSNFLTSIKFYEKELFVDSGQTRETEFPVLLMDWVDGEPLDKYIHNNANNQYALEILSYRFGKLSAWLLAQPFAHGDLKPDNILVKEDGSIVLVDYDGMYVPAMKGQKARELGSPNFRHPSRTEEAFDERIDDFSIALIALSIKAFSLNTELISEYCTNDFMLFRIEDYPHIHSCQAMSSILNIVYDDELTSLLGTFMIAYAENGLNFVSPNMFNLKNPKEGQAYAESLYNQARNLCEEAKDKSKIDHKKAFEMFYEASLLGNADAQCCLGCCYKNGYGTTKDYTKSKEWCDKSAKNGNSRALRHIGFLYHDGIGVEKDIKKAIEWYDKAIDAGDISAMVTKGAIFYYGIGGIPIDYEEAAKLYIKAAVKGDDDGMWRLARCYQKGKGVEQNHQIAFEWFKQSAYKKNSNGLYGLGVCYHYGYGVEKNYKRAVELYEKAALDNQKGSLWRLGHCYEYGQGVEKDLAKAFEWYRKSAEQGTAEGQWRLGQCYRYARGVQRNIREALCWYKKAAEQGHEKATDVYRMLKDSSFEIYREGCIHIKNKEYKDAYDVFYSISSDAWGQNGLGFCCAQGLFVEQNLGKAAYWFQKAARQGLAVAQYNLALCYYLGKGIRTDKALASYWKEKAVEQGFIPAKVLESWERTPFYKSLGIESYNFDNTLKNQSFLLKDDVL